MKTRMRTDLLLRHKLLNWLQSLLMLAGMGGLLALLGWLLGGTTLMVWTLLLTLVLFLLTPRFSARLILRLYGARPLAPQELPRLHAVLAELSRRAELPRPPALYYVPSAILNAFAVGRREDAAVAVTDGLLRHLDLRELTGVLAHEVSHIRHNDMWVMGLADVMSRTASLLSLFGQLLLFVNLPLLLLGQAYVSWLAVLILLFAPTVVALLQLALSRTREFDADLGAVQLTGDPEGLASALAKLERHQRHWLARVLLPGRREPEPSLLRTHPATEERIARLRELSTSPPRTPPLPALLDDPYFLFPEALPDHLPVIVRRPRRRRMSGLWY